MANGADEENFVVLSRVRMGLKREFAFALKVQSEICGSLGRTRGRSAQNVASATPELRTYKRMKREVKAEKKQNGVKENEIVVEGSVDPMSEEEAKSDVVDVEEKRGDQEREKEAKVCEEESVMVRLEKEHEVRDVVVDAMCEDESEKGTEEKKELVTMGEFEQEERELKMGEEEKEDDGERARSGERVDSVMCLEDGKEQGQENRNEPENAVLDVEEKCAGDAAKDQNRTIETEKAVLNVNEEEEGKVNRKENNSEVSINGEEPKAKDDLEIECQPEKVDFNQEVSSEKMPIMVYSDVCTTGDALVEEKPLRRFTRSLLRPTAETANKAASKYHTGETNSKGGDDGKVEGVSTPVKQEVVISQKIVRSFPAKLKDLLDSGILEGMNVKYIRSSKVARGPGATGLSGIIKGSSILCFCKACKGVQVVTPTVYEVHAGSSNKRPPEYIHLENGKTLRDVMNVCKEHPLTTMEKGLQVVVGSSMRKSNFCLNCRGSMAGVGSGESMILCASCMELKEPQDTSDEASNIGSRSPKPTPAMKLSQSAPQCSSSQTKSQGRVTRKDLRMHKLVFEEDGLPEGTELAYFVRGQKLLVGYKKGFGIHCSCCNTEVSPSQFEAHAGWATRRKPFQHIYMSNGVSLHEFSISLSKDRKFSTNENDDLCSICLDGGNLMCCDTCPRAFHRVREIASIFQIN